MYQVELLGRCCKERYDDSVIHTHAVHTGPQLLNVVKLAAA